MVGITVVILGIMAYYAFMPVSKSDKNAYIYIDRDDDLDSVATKLSAECKEFGVSAFKVLARHSSYSDNIRTGRYEITPSVGALTLFRQMRNGVQSPIMLTVPSVRTMDRMAEELSKKLMIDKEDLLVYLTNNDSCKIYGYDTCTIPCLFIPETYDMHWDASPRKVLERMKKESDKFWTKERLAKAKALNLSVNEVVTLASIVDEETANNGEKPMIAGLYYNRLRKPMKLQADPTVKFALKQFQLKRIYNDMLLTPSPYNTYVNEGLPPGPIRVPSIAGIDAVLNMAHHDYLYMCAKEDFSGTHNFAVTYEEHKANAARYVKALNERNIK